MKITFNSLINTVTNSIQTNLNKLQSLQEKLSTGKNIARPSDNPVNTAQLNIYKTKKNQHEQFIKTIDNSLSWLEATENSLSEINNSLVSIRSICIQAGNGALNQEGLNALLLQVDQLKNKLLTDANAQYLGNYIFGGLNTLQKPFEEVGDVVNYNGDSENLWRAVSFDSNISINIDGKRLFNYDNTVSADPNLFQVISNLKEALRSGDTNSISGQILEQIDRASTNIQNLISEIGAKVKRLELTKQQHENEILNLTKSISIIEDIDFPSAVMELQKAEIIYSSSLNLAGRIFPRSLLDYLK